MFGFNPVPKPQHKRIKSRARQRGAISTKVREQLKERSQGICERCKRAKAVHAAHITRRWKLERTTVDDLLHLCVPCHVWADTTREGREFLKAREQGMNEIFKDQALQEQIKAMLNAKEEQAETCIDGKEHEYMSIGHSDSRDSYTWYFKCSHCGDVVKKTNKRTGLDKAFWSGEEE